MSNVNMFTPCKDKRYEKCGNFVPNYYMNPPCQICIHDHDNCLLTKGAVDNYVPMKEKHRVFRRVGE